MKKIKINFWFFILVTFLQFNYSQEFSKSFLKESAQIILNDSKTCILTTISEDGSPSSRVMDPFIPKDDFIVYMVTNPKSRKVAEIYEDPRVVLVFQNKSGYVSIKGLVSIINNPTHKIKFWKKEWTPYYDSKENAFLFKVLPYSLEIVNFDSGISGNLKTWTPPKVSF